MDVWPQDLTIDEWRRLIDSAEAGGLTEPILNVDPDDDREYDAIFIGGGAGGRFGSAFLRARGGRQLTVDRWPFLGGSCPHQACVPHHLFSEVAHQLDLARTLAGRLWYPKAIDESAIEMLDIVELFRSERNGMHAFMNWQSKHQLGMEFILNATATVLDATTVEVASVRYKARNLVLGTGARTLPPDIPGTELAGVHDFASLVDELDYNPSRCVVIGGGKVAVEYGSFFQATGVPTTIVSRSPLLAGVGLRNIDDDVRGFVVDGMVDRGITIHEGVEPVAIVGVDGRAIGVDVAWADGTVAQLPVDLVFLATGERACSQPYVDVLGVLTDPAGSIKVDGRMRTSVPGVYAVGDLIGPPLEMFKARKCGMTAARNIMGEAVDFDFSSYPDFLHTTYEVTWLGLSEAQARVRYDDVVVLQMPPVGVEAGDIMLPCAEGSMLLAFIAPAHSGFQKCVIDVASRRVVGVHHVGFGAKDAFQYLDYLMSRPEGLTIDQLAGMNELYLSSEYFIHLSRLRAGQLELTSL